MLFRRPAQAAVRPLGLCVAVVAVEIAVNTAFSAEGAEPPAGSAPAVALSAAERAGLVDRWLESVRTTALRLDDSTQLDADVRRHAESLKADALAALKREAQALLGASAAMSGARPDEIEQMIGNGMMAALARLHLGRHDPNQASAWLPALAAPRLCDQPGPEASWRQHLQMLQRLPVAAREAAFAADRKGLAALADPAWQPPARPSPTPLEALPDWAAEQRAGRDDGKSLGMAPATAYVVFAESGTRKWTYWPSRCRLAQWWALNLLHRNQADAATALLGYRYATMLRPQDWIPDRGEETPGYPSMAARFGVEGTVTVQWQRDALGKPRDPRIVSRSVQLPHGPETAALVWEDQFDEAALARLKSQPAQAASAGTEAGARQSAELVFKLQ